MESPTQCSSRFANHNDFAISANLTRRDGAVAKWPRSARVAFKIGDSADELRRAKEHLDALGVGVMADHTVSESLYIEDPDGKSAENYIDVSDVWRSDPQAIATGRHTGRTVRLGKGDQGGFVQGGGRSRPGPRLSTGLIAEPASTTPPCGACTTRPCCATSDSCLSIASPRRRPPRSRHDARNDGREKRLHRRPHHHRPGQARDDHALRVGRGNWDR